MPSAISASRNADDKKRRRVVDRCRARKRRGLRRNLTAHDDARRARQTVQGEPAGSRLCHRHKLIVDLQPASARPHLNGDGIAGGGARPNDEIDGSFVVLERAHGRRIAVRQVVERPAVSKPVVVEEVVVPDDAAFNTRDAGIANLARNGSQRARRVAALADARVAASNDDEIAAQNALVDSAQQRRPSSRTDGPTRAALRPPPR